MLSILNNIGKIADIVSLFKGADLGKTAGAIMELVKNGGDVNGDNKVDIMDAKDFVLKLIDSKNASADKTSALDSLASSTNAGGTDIMELIKNLTSGKVGEYLEQNNGDDFKKIKDFLANKA